MTRFSRPWIGYVTRLLLIASLSLPLAACIESKGALLRVDDLDQTGPKTIFALAIHPDGTLELDSKGEVSGGFLVLKDGFYVPPKENADTQAPVIEIGLVKFDDSTSRIAEILNFSKDPDNVQYALAKFQDDRVDLYLESKSKSHLDDNAATKDEVVARIKELNQSTSKPFISYLIARTDDERTALVSRAKKAMAELKSKKAADEIATADTSGNVDVNDVTLCDELAAHPSDPRRMATGVEMPKIIPIRAKTACEEAASKYPNTPRFTYQLGRALQASGDPQGAIAAFIKASSMGYPMADYNVGIDIADKEDDASQEKAKAYLKRAAANGVTMAQAALDEIVFSSSGFNNGSFFEAIYQGQGIAASPLTMTYVQELLSMYYKSDMSECSRLVSPDTMLKGGLAGTFGALGALGSPTRLASQVNNAQSDAQSFYDRYGCTSMIARRFFSNLSSWIARN